MFRCMQMQASTHPHTHTYTLTCRQTQTLRQTDRQKHTYTHTHTHNYPYNTRVTLNSVRPMSQDVIDAVEKMLNLVVKRQFYRYFMLNNYCMDNVSLMSVKHRTSHQMLILSLQNLNKKCTVYIRATLLQNTSSF